MAALGLRAASSRPASLALPRPLQGERCNIVFAAERRYRLSLALSPHPFLVRLHRTAAVSSSCRLCERHVHARAQPLPPLGARSLWVPGLVRTEVRTALCGCRLGCEKGERDQRCVGVPSQHTCRSVRGAFSLKPYVCDNEPAAVRRSPHATHARAALIERGLARREYGIRQYRNYEAPRGRRRAARPGRGGARGAPSGGGTRALS